MVPISDFFASSALLGVFVPCVIVRVGRRLPRLVIQVRVSAPSMTSQGGSADTKRIAELRRRCIGRTLRQGRTLSSSIPREPRGLRSRIQGCTFDKKISPEKKIGL